MEADKEKVKNVLEKTIQKSPLVKDILGPVPKTSEEIWREMGLLIE